MAKTDHMKNCREHEQERERDHERAYEHEQERERAQKQEREHEQERERDHERKQESERTHEQERTVHPLPQIDQAVMEESAEAHPKDTLANDEPVVLESSASDPEFPAMQEFEVDTDGPKGSTAKHPGIIWAIIAIVAIIILCIVLAAVGDWMTPNQAERNAETQFEEQTVPEDLGSNENPEAMQEG